MTPSNFGSPSQKPPRPPAKFGGGPKMAPPKPPEEENPEASAEGGKASREDALFVSSDKHCGNCSNYSQQDGSCAKVDGQFDPEDACLRYFQAGSSEQETPEEEATEVPGMEATEMPE